MVIRRKDIFNDIYKKGLFNHLRLSYGSEFVIIVKDYFNVSRKMCKIKNDIKFLLECEIEGVLPNFTRFRLMNPRLNKNQSKRNYQKDIVQAELKSHKHDLRELKIRAKALYDIINFKVVPVDWNLIKTKLDLLISTFDIQTKKTQNAKLHDLTFDNRFEVLEDETDNLKMAESLFNLSNVKLNEKEKKVLSKGLKFACKNVKVDSFDLLVNFEIACQQLNRLPIKKNDDAIDKLKLNEKQAFNNDFQKFAVDFNKNLIKSKNNLTKEEINIIRRISKNRNIVISKADKGNAVVIQNKSDYIKQAEGILSDKSKFKCLESDPTIERELKLQRKLYYMLRKGSLSEDTYRKIRPVGSKCGTYYGLPKIHKCQIPGQVAGRPIISAIGTYTYNLAKWLVSILKPLKEDSRFTVKDTFDFCTRFKKLKHLHHLKMISFDVKSLFTNVPTDEVIKIILDKAFSDKLRTIVKKRKVVVEKVEKSEWYFGLGL